MVANSSNTDSGCKEEVPDFALEALAEMMGKKTMTRDDPNEAAPKGGQQQQQRYHPRKISSRAFGGLEKRSSKKFAK